MNPWMNDVSDGCLAIGEGTAEKIFRVPVSKKKERKETLFKCQVYLVLRHTN